MQTLWTKGALAVRDVCHSLEGTHTLAYTTVMTTLDRLYKKGLLKRRKEGLAFVYEPAFSRDEYRCHIVEQTVSRLMSRAANADPVLAAFVDAAAEVDEDNLRRLEDLIAERRRSGR